MIIGCKAVSTKRLSESPNCVDVILDGTVKAVINTISGGLAPCAMACRLGGAP